MKTHTERHSMDIFNGHGYAVVLQGGVFLG
jgi:hypothetical protein